MAVAFVRQQQISGGSSATSQPFTVTTVTAGNFVTVQTTSYGAPVTGVTLGGVAMTQAGGGHFDTGTDASYQQEWYLPNAAGGSSVALALTSGTATISFGNVSEYSGMPSAVAVRTYGANGVSGSPSPGAIVGGGTSLLGHVSMADINGNAPSVYPSGWTSMTPATTAGWWGAYLISPTSQTPTFTVASQDWNSFGVVYDVAPSGRPPQTVRDRLIPPIRRRGRQAAPPLAAQVTVTARFVPQGVRDRPVPPPQRRRRGAEPPRVTVVVVVPQVPFQPVRDRLFPMSRRRGKATPPLPAAVTVTTTQSLPPQPALPHRPFQLRRRTVRTVPVPTVVTVTTTQALLPQPARARRPLLPRRKPVRAIPVPTIVVTVRALPPQPARAKPRWFPPLRRKSTVAVPVPPGLVIPVPIRFEYPGPDTAAVTFQAGDLYADIAWQTGPPAVTWQAGDNGMTWAAGDIFVGWTTPPGPTFEEPQ